MKIFFFALREYDELRFVEEFSRKYDFTYDYTSAYPTVENADLAKGYDALSIITNPMYPELLDRYAELGIKYISTRSIGYDHIDLVHAKKLGMGIAHVTYSPNSVANYTIMLILMATRNMPFIMKQADNQNFALQGKMGKELSLSTVGIIGTGKIGETVARRLKGFGCRILANDIYPKESLNGIVEYVDLDTLLGQSDFVSLHVPMTAATAKMINAESIAKMKDGAVLINCARGGVVDSEALAAALNSGKLAAAGIDVFENEPPLAVEHPLLQAKNTVVTPHVAFASKEALEARADIVFANIDAFLAGKPQNLVK